MDQYDRKTVLLVQLKNTSTGVFTNVFAINASGEYTGTKLVGQGTADVIVAAAAGTTEVEFSQPR